MAQSPTTLAPNAQGDISFSWATELASRDGTLTTDGYMLNCFSEGEPGDGVAIVKRPGSSYFSSGVTGVAQGQFAYNGQYYYIVNNVAYPSGSSAGGIAIPSPGPTIYAYTSIDQQVPGVGVSLTVIQNAVGALWTFNGSVFVKVTDANYTASQVSGIAYLDGVFYAMRINGQLIGSAINDPTTWPALDFVSADIQFGQGVGVSRHLNYILAFYDKGLQVYYDANAAPNGSGIALNPVLSASFRTGCVNPQTIVELGDNTIFLAHTVMYGRTVQLLTGLTLGSISTPWVEKILNNPLITDNFGNLNVWAFGIQISGHQFYVLTLVPLNFTLVYDVTMRQWSTWASLVSGTLQYFTGRFYTRQLQGDILQDVSTGRQILMSPTIYLDATGNLPVTCFTPPMDWGTMNYKRFAAMYQFGDTTNTLISVSFSDNDYVSFSTPRTVDMSTVRKSLRNCGSSRRRIWQMNHTDNTPLRLESMVIPLAVGSR